MIASALNKFENKFNRYYCSYLNSPKCWVTYILNFFKMNERYFLLSRKLYAPDGLVIYNKNNVNFILFLFIDSHIATLYTQGKKSNIFPVEIINDVQVRLK